MTNNQDTLKPLLVPNGSITVNYELALKVMLIEGRCTSKNVDIDLSRFELHGQGVERFETKVFQFKRQATSEEAEESIREYDRWNPWEPARVEHLLAYDAQCTQGEWPHFTIGLGHPNETVGHRRVACLQRKGSRNFLYFLWWVFDWDTRHRFLAVRRKPEVPK